MARGDVQVALSIQRTPMVFRQKFRVLQSLPNGTGPNGFDFNTLVTQIPSFATSALVFASYRVMRWKTWYQPTIRYWPGTSPTTGPGPVVLAFSNNVPVLLTQNVYDSSCARFASPDDPLIVSGVVPSLTTRDGPGWSLAADNVTLPIANLYGGIVVQNWKTSTAASLASLMFEFDVEWREVYA